VLWEAECKLKMEKRGVGGEKYLGCWRITTYRDVGGCNELIRRRRGVGEIQVQDAEYGGKTCGMWEFSATQHISCSIRTQLVIYKSVNATKMGGIE